MRNEESRECENQDARSVKTENGREAQWDPPAEPRRRVRITYGRPGKTSDAPWIWIAVIFAVALAMVASRGCSSSLENLARLFTESTGAQPDGGVSASPEK